MSTPTARNPSTTAAPIIVATRTTALQPETNLIRTNVFARDCILPSGTQNPAINAAMAALTAAGVFDLDQCAVLQERCSVITMGEVPFLVWREDFAVGHQALDSEHHALVDAINNIHAAEIAKRSFIQVSPLLNALMRQTVEHFHHEDLVLRSILKGPVPGANRLTFLGSVATAAFDQHIFCHNRSIARLDSIIKRKSGEEQDFSLGLRDWFVDHAIKYDGLLKPVFKALKH